MDNTINDMKEQLGCEENEIIPEDLGRSDIKRNYGYYEILKKAGRDRYYRQRYIVRCKSCQQIYTKTLHEIKQAEGSDKCKHTHKTTKAATEPHPCAHCGQMTTNLKYCSASCKAIAVNQATKTKVRYCLICGKPTEKRSHTMCSDECRRIYRLNKMYGFELGSEKI